MFGFKVSRESSQIDESPFCIYQYGYSHYKTNQQSNMCFFGCCSFGFQLFGADLSC